MGGIEGREKESSARRSVDLTLQEDRQKETYEEADMPPPFLPFGQEISAVDCKLLSSIWPSTGDG